jgi:hypothetical protein
MKWQDPYFPVFDSEVLWALELTTQASKKIAKHIHYGVIDGCEPDAFANSNQLIVTNNIFKPNVLGTTVYEQFPNSWYGIYSGPVIQANVSIDKNFNCFINRMDPSRQSWFYQLIRRNLLDQGYVSFNMDVARNIPIHRRSPSQSLPKQIPAIEIFEKQFQNDCAIFAAEHEIAKSIVPYKNFNDSSSLENVLLRTKFSIVLETWFHDNRVTTVSEKIFRCLRAPRPWILYSTQHAVTYLRSIGFDVLDDVVNHDYDLVESPIDRQVKLLDLAQELCKIEFNEKLIGRCQSAAEHNCKLLEQLHSTFRQDVESTITRLLNRQ